MFVLSGSPDGTSRCEQSVLGVPRTPACAREGLNPPRTPRTGRSLRAEYYRELGEGLGTPMSAAHGGYRSPQEGDWPGETPEAFSRLRKQVFPPRGQGVASHPHGPVC